MAKKPRLEVRLNDLDLTRATEQTAILMSRLMGRGVTRHASAGQSASPKTARSGWRDLRTRLVAARIIFGYLKNAYCAGQVVKCPFIEEPNTQRKSKGQAKLLEEYRGVWGEFSGEERFGRQAQEENWELDFVLCPLDGARDLVKGYDNGSISVIGGGPPGSFRFPLPFHDALRNGPEHYFVIALTEGTTIDDPVLPSFLNVNRADEADVVPVMTFCGVDRWLNKHLGHEVSYLTVAAMEQDQPRDLRPWLAKRFRVRTFRGSTVAAATSVFCSRYGIDAFLGVVGQPQVTLIATAARTIGAKMWAFPVRWPRKADEEKKASPKEKDAESKKADKKPAHVDAKVLPNTPVYDIDAFVAPQMDVFLVATGISEHLLLKGVRFRRADLAETQTLVLRSLTRSSRYISNHHHLDRKKYALHEPCPDARQIIASMKNYIRREAAKRRSLRKPEVEHDEREAPGCGPW